MTVYETPAGVRLRLRLPSGSIEVRTADTSETTVEVDLLRGDRAALDAVRQEMVPGGGGVAEIVVDARDGGARWFGRGASLRFRVIAPHGADLDADTASADVRAEGRFGTVRVEAASGDMRIEDVEGEARASTASGSVAIGAVGGGATVNTASGSVRIHRAQDVLVHTASGRVTLEEADGTIEANTASGDVEIAAVSEGDVRVRTASGDIRVGVRPGRRVWLDLSSKSGRATSDLESGDGEAGADRRPAVEIRAASMSGDVRIVRAAAAPIADAGGREHDGPAGSPPRATVPGAAGGRDAPSSTGFLSWRA